MTGKRLVALDFRDLLLVDREAVKLPAVHEPNGAELRNCVTHIRESVTNKQTQMPFGLNSRKKKRQK